MKINKLFLDLDGVICDFDNGIYSVVSKLIEDGEFIKTLTDIEKKNAISIWKILRPEKESGVRTVMKNPDFKNTIRKFIAYEKDWWANLKWTSDGKELWDYVKQYNPTILSSSLGGTNATPGKTQWVKKNLGDNVKCDIIDDKETLATPDSLLIDDRSQIVKKFADAGGQIILHTDTSSTIRKLKMMINESKINNIEMELSINEAESFLKSKESGRVLNFNDFVFENISEELDAKPGKDDEYKYKVTYTARINPYGVSRDAQLYFKSEKDAKEYLDKNKPMNGEYVGLNESEEHGYGQQAFFFAKNGDTNNYFFKLKSGQEDHGFVVSIGKFAKFTQPTEQKINFGVLGITKLSEADLDQAVIDEGKFTTNSETIVADEKLLGKILEQLSLIVEDYLQKNPAVSKFYDELQSSLQAPDYDNKLAVSLSKWPGNWHLQIFEKNKLNIISK